MHRRTVSRGLAALALPGALGTLGALAGTPAHAALAAGATPDFTLRRLDGPNLRLQEQRGRVVMVNFWATWCAPCRQEMPHLNRLHERFHAAGFVLLGVSVDEDPAKATAMAQSMGLRFPVLFDSDKAVARQWSLGAMPSTVLIGRDGRVRHIHRGWRDGLEATYEAQVIGLLKE
jgi:peroxiredoxin